nr:hypothetical protein [Janibacter limosus]
MAVTAGAVVVVMNSQRPRTRGSSPAGRSTERGRVTPSAPFALA